MYVPHFPWFSVSVPYSRAYSVYFSFSTFFSLSSHIPGQTVFVSHFPSFWLFLAINSSPTVCISQFLRFQCSSPYFTSYCLCFSFSIIYTFLTIFQVLQCAFLIFSLFTVSRHITPPTVHVYNFPWFSVNSTLFQVLQCAFLTFLVFQFFRHIGDHTVFSSHFPLFSFFSP